jgi:tetratricopeptide (TPR) repeat protein
MKCNRCGLESDIREAFVVRKRWAGLVTRSFCPACWEKQFVLEQVFSLALVTSLIALLDALTFQRGPIRVAADMLFIVLINYPVIAAHELAHAAAGKALGIRVFKVIIGNGRILFSRRWAGIGWEWHMWPFGGGTLMASPPHQAGSRARFFGAVLAGPAMHVLLIAAAVMLQVFLLILQGWFGVRAMDLLHWASLFFFINLILLINNLWPAKSGSAAGQLGTDGWQLLHLLLQKPEEVENRDVAYYWLESMDASERNDELEALRWIDQGLAGKPEQIGLRGLRGNVLLKLKRFTEAREVYQHLLFSKEAGEPYFKYLTYNNIAYADILMRDPALLPEADRYSDEALKQIGWSSAVIGTRGAVLVEMGRLEEGIRLLKEALEKSKEGGGKASNAYHLAVAERKRGNESESHRYLQLTRKYNPHFFLLDESGM